MKLTLKQPGEVYRYKDSHGVEMVAFMDFNHEVQFNEYSPEVEKVIGDLKAEIEELESEWREGPDCLTGSGSPEQKPVGTFRTLLNHDESKTLSDSETEILKKHFESLYTGPRTVSFAVSAQPNIKDAITYLKGALVVSRVGEFVFKILDIVGGLLRKIKRIG